MLGYLNAGPCAGANFFQQKLEIECSSRVSAGVDARHYILNLTRTDVDARPCVSILSVRIISNRCEYPESGLRFDGGPNYGLTATKSGLQEIGTVPRPL